MRRVGWSLVVVSLVAACGGGVASNSDGASSSSSGGGASSSSSSSGSGSGASCSAIGIDGTRACVPGLAPANQPIVVQVDDQQGCLSCFTKVDRCSATIEGNVITLAMSGTQCTPSGDLACTGDCAIPSAKCTLPPLSPGKYLVAVAGEGARTGLVPRELVVSDDTSAKTETSCTVTSPAKTVLDGTKYSTSCSKDDDCQTATFGELCRPCNCPNAAISTGASDVYEADKRATVSQCPTVKGVSPVCAACPPMKARCEILGDALTGTCKLDMN